MKDVIENRIKRIEELLKSENTICMVALRDETGIHWNDNTYPDEDALGEAVRLIAGDYRKTPLVIISKIRVSENKCESLC